MRQDGYIFRKGDSWFVRYRDNSLVDGVVVREQKCKRLAAFCDQYRTKKDLEGLKADFLNPINSGKARPESTVTVAEFAEKHWLPGRGRIASRPRSRDTKPCGTRTSRRNCKKSPCATFAR